MRYAARWRRFAPRTTSKRLDAVQLGPPLPAVRTAGTRLIKWEAYSAVVASVFELESAAATGTPFPAPLETKPETSFTVTVAPFPGVNVIARLVMRSPASGAGASLMLRAIAPRTCLISKSAKLAPRQRRTPPPNGIQV